MKTRVSFGLGVVAAVLLLGWWSRPAPQGTEEVRGERERSVGGGVQAPTAVALPQGQATEPEPEERALQPYDRVVRACGFDVEERCVESGCGAVVAMPDLDRFDGWVRLLWEQPGVVGSTAARDLGLPVAWTSCGDALESSPDVIAAQMDWNQELWCVGDRSACDVAAAERYGWRGFTGGVRLTRRVFVLD